MGWYWSMAWGLGTPDLKYFYFVYSKGLFHLILLHENVPTRKEWEDPTLVQPLECPLGADTAVFLASKLLSYLPALIPGRSIT